MWATHADAKPSPDGRWLTYDQLARSGRIDRPSAVRVAICNNWQRRKDNTGQTQVYVPEPWFERSRGADTEAADARLGVAEANRRADAALAVADRALGQLVDTQAALNSERTRVTELRRELDMARATVKDTAHAAAVLGQAAEARKSTGRWARLKAAWRGV